MAKGPAISIERPSLDYLAHRGPNRVAVGDLSVAGLPGVVFAPVRGTDLPVVALSHGWLQPASRYADTLRYLASWGMVAVAPNTQRGPLPSHGAMALDLQSALHAVSSGRLGGGRVRVDGSRLGVIGHSIGGGAAVLAAASNSGISAVVTVTAAATRPSAVEAAARVQTPSLHLVGSDDEFADGEGREIAAAWAGPSQLRTIKATSHLGLSEGKHWTSTILGSGNEKRVQQITRMLATAFLLRHLADGDQLADDLESKVAKTTLEDLDEVRAEA